jgi:ABC-type uncharacterized transport system ATPase subunit
MTLMRKTQPLTRFTTRLPQPIQELLWVNSVEQNVSISQLICEAMQEKFRDRLNALPTEQQGTNGNTPGH